MTSTRGRQLPAHASSHRLRGRTPRPSLLLWRHRHLVVALCLGAAVVVALSVLRPGPAPAQEVLVAARAVSAGSILTEDDVDRRAVPTAALPRSGLVGPEVVGSRSAISLEPGTVLTTSMTSAALTQGLDPSERVVQVPVDVGATLAEPGARVDVIGETRLTGHTGYGGVEDSSAEHVTSTGTWGAQQGAVLARNARVLTTQPTGDTNQWVAGAKVTLVTLAVSSGDATLVAGAATTGALSIVLSP